MLQWTDSNHPPAFDSLDAGVRDTAIEQANALLRDGTHPRRALSMGIARARDADEGTPNDDLAGPEIYVAPFGDKWWVWVETTDEAMPFASLEDALRRGGELGQKHGSAMYLCDSHGLLTDKFEYFDGKDEGTFVVMPYDGQWAVRELGPAPTFETFDTKKDAISRGRELAHESEATLRVHYENGEVQKRKDYS